MPKPLFEILGPFRKVEVIASGRTIRVANYLRAQFGGRKWRKMKGVALVRDIEGEVYEAEIHWFEAHGVGRRLERIKRPYIGG
jgi:hypothetical protein